MQEGHLSTYQPINLSIYDLVGRLVTTLVAEEKPAGFHSAEYEEIEKALDIKSYFCTPYHSWEKGTVVPTCRD